MSAIDVRGLGQALPSGGKTADFDFDGAAPPSVPGGGTDAPGTYVDKPFTIGANEGNSKATIEVTWDNGANDWDLVVYRKEGDALVEAGTSGRARRPRRRPSCSPAPSRATTSSACATSPRAAPSRAPRASSPPRRATRSADRSAAYAGFCGYCDALNTRPFANGIATNVSPAGDVGKAGAADGWRVAKAQGLPKRYITSVQIDPSDVRTVYVTLGGYSRRWLKPGVLGEDADLGGGNVYKSTDAGETFRDISGNLPDIPANWTLVRGGQLLVATNLGVFVSADTDGGALRGARLRAADGAGVLARAQAEGEPSEPDTLIAATQGRGVYRYAFKDPAKACTSAARSPARRSSGPGRG